MNNFIYKPTFNRVIIERQEVEEKIGSIIIPDESKSKPFKGTIIAVGVEAKGFKVGHKVVFGRYSGTELELDGKTYLLMVDKDVLTYVIDQESE